MASYHGAIFYGVYKNGDKGICLSIIPLSSTYGCSGEDRYYCKGEEEKFLKDFPCFSGVSWDYDNNQNKGIVSLSLPDDANITKVFSFRNIGSVIINGRKFNLDSDTNPFLQVEKITNTAGVIRLCDRLVLFPIEAFVEFSASFSAVVLEDALRKVLNEENSDLIRVIRDCPYIPIRSLNGRDGAIYKDGELIHLEQLGKTFEILGSFHIIRDSDLNLATCYVLGLDKKEPSLIVPEVVLNQLKGGG